MTGEKITASVEVSCRPSERKAWLAAFPRGDLSRIARALLNAAARKSTDGAKGVVVRFEAVRK